MSKLEILEELVKKQNELLSNYAKFFGAMPFSADESVKDHEELVRVIEELSRRLRAKKR